MKTRKGEKHRGFCLYKFQTSGLTSLATSLRASVTPSPVRALILDNGMSQASASSSIAAATDDRACSRYCGSKWARSALSASRCEIQDRLRHRPCWPTGIGVLSLASAGLSEWSWLSQCRSGEPASMSVPSFHRPVGGGRRVQDLPRTESERSTMSTKHVLASGCCCFAKSGSRLQGSTALLVVRVLRLVVGSSMSCSSSATQAPCL